ncbi:C3H1-type domain-containing protein [Mycena venus]|uniref:C3H1-type domain-containing protein n=1 Tax=Mycena venus TaxID=2733690 RepID=A0A8H6XD66_9AGAR|nr:C3H1-type domain-containing protein [Mycena venus]
MTLPLQLSDESKRAERLVGLFRSLARLSNQVVQDTAVHEREGQKLQTYTEISSALSKISTSAATSVAPTLADIMLKHEQSKHRVEESYKALGGVWEQVFDVFVTEVVHVIDSRLQNAMTTLKNESERAVKEIAESAAGSLKSSTAGDSVVPYDRKRARTRGPAEKENEDSRPGRGASRDRDHKRRRFASRSPSPDLHDRRSSRHVGDSSIEGILTQMKMKIDLLTKENDEV